MCSTPSSVLIIVPVLTHMKGAVLADIIVTATQKAVVAAANMTVIPILNSTVTWITAAAASR